MTIPRRAFVAPTNDDLPPLPYPSTSATGPPQAQHQDCAAQDSGRQPATDVELGASAAVAAYGELARAAAARGVADATQRGAQCQLELVGESDDAQSAADADWK